MNDSASAPRISWQRALLLFIAVLFLAAPQAGLLPLLDRDEPRFAEAAREMQQSRDFVVPTFNHAPRYAKPPLIYWCQAATFVLFGENAIAARLPSLLATAATAVLLYTWGVRLGNAHAGLGAGLCYAFCFQALQQGRVATADALLIFFMTLTTFAGWMIIRPCATARSRTICFTVLALGFAGGFLAKGPEALLPIAPLIWCARGEDRVVMIRIIACFFAGLALVLPWAIPAYVETNGDYWKQGLNEGIGQRAFSGLQGHGASNFGGYLLGLPYYVLLFWISALPWSPLILLNWKKLFASWKPDATDTYLLLNAALVFLVFTLMVTKLPHYTLPVFPLLALFFTRRWCDAGLRRTTPIRLAGYFGLGFAVLTAVAIPIALAYHLTPSPVGELVRAAGDNLEPDTEFALVDFQEPNAIWEMRGATVAYAKFIPEQDVAKFLDQPGSHAVVLSTPLFDKLPAPSPNWKVFHAHGLNAAKLRTFDITLVVKP